MCSAERKVKINLVLSPSRFRKQQSTPFFLWFSDQNDIFCFWMLLLEFEQKNLSTKQQV